jgi:hypothetical protein
MCLGTQLRLSLSLRGFRILKDTIFSGSAVVSLFYRNVFFKYYPEKGQNLVPEGVLQTGDAKKISFSCHSHKIKPLSARHSLYLQLQLSFAIVSLSK